MSTAAWLLLGVLAIVLTGLAVAVRIALVIDEERAYERRRVLEMRADRDHWRGLAEMWRGTYENFARQEARG